MSKKDIFTIISLVIFAAGGILFYSYAKELNKRKELEKEMSLRYIDHNNSTITDTSTALMWKKCTEGQTNNINCKGNSQVYNQIEVISNFKSSSFFAGYNDWRIPTPSELKTLLYCSNGVPPDIAYNDSCGDDRAERYEGGEDYVGDYDVPTIYQKIFPNTERSSYWVNDNGNAIWGVDFNHGIHMLMPSQFIPDQVDTGFVRLVRRVH